MAEILAPCKNLGKAKKGDLVARVRPDVKVISLTHFGSRKNCKPSHFLADSETTELHLNENYGPENEELVYHRWKKETLPQVQYSTTKKYGGVKQVYVGNVEDVLTTLRSLSIPNVHLIDTEHLPGEGLHAAAE